MFRFRRIPLLISALVVLASCSCAFGKEKVIVNPHLGDKRLSDIYITATPTSKAKLFAAVRDLYGKSEPLIEYRKGQLFVLVEVGHDSSRRPITELWRYTSGGKGKRLCICRDYRASNDGKKIAILGDDRVIVIDRNGRVLKKIRLHADDNYGLDNWYGNTLVVELGMWSPDGFICIDMKSYKIRKYDLPSLGITGNEYAFNPKTLWFAYSTYPTSPDVDEKTFREAKETVTLYAYNLRTKHRRTLARSEAKSFEPKWLGSSTLEYDNPKGRGVIRRHVN